MLFHLFSNKFTFLFLGNITKSSLYSCKYLCYTLEMKSLKLTTEVKRDALVEFHQKGGFVLTNKRKLSIFLRANEI